MKLKLSKEQWKLLLKRAGYTKYINVDVIDEKNANITIQTIENPESPQDAALKIVYNMLDDMVKRYERNKLRSK